MTHLLKIASWLTGIAIILALYITFHSPIGFALLAITCVIFIILAVMEDNSKTPKR